MFTRGDPIFAEHVGIPMAIPLAEARMACREFARSNRGMAMGGLVGRLGLGLTATHCPQCGGTGVEFTIEQLDRTP